MKLRLATISVLVLGTILLGGCDTTESDWKQAKDANTVFAYSNFVAKHSNGAHVDEANAAIERLDWSTAKGSQSAAAYEEFLKNHPNRRPEALKKSLGQTAAPGGSPTRTRRWKVHLHCVSPAVW